MLISNAFLIDEIRATDDFKEYETVIIGVDVKMNQLQPVVSTQGMHMITPRAYRTPTLTAASPQEKKRKQRVRETSSPMKSLKVDIEKMVEGEEDKESYASEFADSMLNNDDDDSGTRMEPESHKENPEVVEDDVNVTEKKNDGKHNKDVEETNDATGNMETRKERIQPLIPTPNRFPRKDLSSDKTISKELIATVSPTTATTSNSKSKRGFTFIKTKILLGSIVGINYGVLGENYKSAPFWSLNEDILKITILKTNTPYPSRKIRRIRACTHQRPQRNKAQYAISRRPIRRIGNME
ncbi:hypothetical protein Tco_0837846 [Tanacetum coccineum]